MTSMVFISQNCISWAFYERAMRQTTSQQRCNHWLTQSATPTNFKKIRYTDTEKTGLLYKCFFFDNVYVSGTLILFFFCRYKYIAAHQTAVKCQILYLFLFFMLTYSPYPKQIEIKVVGLNEKKRDLQEVGGDCGDWMERAQDRDRWRTLVNTVMNCRDP
jgi:hypothetical protein